MSGDAFTKTPDTTPEPGPDVETFSLKQWAKGTGLVTRSVTVCGMPQLMGAIEQLKDELERVQAAEFDDDRPMAKSRALSLAEELEAARADMLDSMVTFTFRGLRPGEVEQIKADHGPDDGDGITDLDYKVWAAMCTKVTPAHGNPVKGIDWQDLKALHVGDPDEGIEGLGTYFVNTIVRTANAAASGGGVDVPFSSASSSLIATSSKS